MACLSAKGSGGVVREAVLILHSSPSTRMSVQTQMPVQIAGAVAPASRETASRWPAAGWARLMRTPCGAQLLFYRSALGSLKNLYRGAMASRRWRSRRRRRDFCNRHGGPAVTLIKVEMQAESSQHPCVVRQATFVTRCDYWYRPSHPGKGQGSCRINSKDARRLGDQSAWSQRPHT